MKQNSSYYTLDLGGGALVTAMEHSAFHGGDKLIIIDDRYDYRAVFVLESVN